MNKFKLLLILNLVLLILLSGCGKTESSSQLSKTTSTTSISSTIPTKGTVENTTTSNKKKISPEEAKKLILKFRDFKLEELIYDGTDEKTGDYIITRESGSSSGNAGVSYLVNPETGDVFNYVTNELEFNLFSNQATNPSSDVQGTISQSDKPDTTISSNNDSKKLPDTKFRFGKSDISIGKKYILDLTYEEIVKLYGEPDEIQSYKIYPPATEPENYLNLLIVKYKGVDFEFYPTEEKMDKPLNSDTVFRFDLTSDNIVLDCGLKVGMTIDEVKKQFGDSMVYTINDSQETFNLGDIRHILSSYKPENYYSEYSNSKAMILLSDSQKFNSDEVPLYKGLVLLLKDGKVDRIVLGYPTAD